MKRYVENQPCSLVARGCIDDTAQYLLTLWQRTSGVIESPNLFEGVAPFFVRLSGHIPTNDSPEILFVGKHSLLGRSAKNARRSGNDRRNFFDPDYRRMVRQGFEQALWEPTCQLIQDSFETDVGPCLMTYDRITLSWKAKQTQFIFSYSRLLDIYPLKRQSHQALDHDHSRLLPNQNLWKQEDHPNEDHFHRL